ncbi:hypothetical protein ACOMHN_040653 [Nucella lapillus]
MGIQDTQKHISGLQRCALFLLSMMSSHLPLTSSTAFGPSDVRQTVSLHVIAHLSFQRGYQRTLESTLSRAQYSRNMEYAWVFQHFNPQVKVVRLPYDNPGDILRHFCDEIFNETSTTVLHIINPFEHFRSESAQYVSSLIRHVGLPVITWGPEYVAASNKVFTCFSSLVKQQQEHSNYNSNETKEEKKKKKKKKEKEKEKEKEKKKKKKKKEEEEE